MKNAVTWYSINDQFDRGNPDHTVISSSNSGLYKIIVKAMKDIRNEYPGRISFTRAFGDYSETKEKPVDESDIPRLIEDFGINGFVIRVRSDDDLIGAILVSELGNGILMDY